MNKKEHFESEQAIEMTARALGETETSSSPSVNGQYSAVQMEVELEQVRELGRVIRDSSSHDAEKWANPDDAVRLKDLIESEFVSGKLMSTDNTGQMRLAALAASILLIAGIGYALVRTPRVEVSPIAELAAQNTEKSREGTPTGNDEFGGANAFEVQDAMEATISSADRRTRKMESQPATVHASMPERMNTIEETESGTVVGEFAASPVTDGKFDQQGVANDQSIRLAREQLGKDHPSNSGIQVNQFPFSGERNVRRSGSSDLDEVLQLLEPGSKGDLVAEEGKAIIEGGDIGRSIDLVQNPSATIPDTEYQLAVSPDPGGKNGESPGTFSFYMGVDGDRGNAPIVIDSNGTKVPLPEFAGSSETSTVDAPDGGTVLLGGIKSTSDGKMSLLRKPDLDVPFSQNSFGAPPPQFGGFGESRDESSRYRNGHGENGFRPDSDRTERQSAEKYELPPENRFLAPVGEQALSTFSIDVDTASYSNIRRFITNGQLPPGNAVRIEEMVNYFSYDYPQPVDGKPFSVSLDVAQCPWQPANKLVRVGIQGRDIPRDDRPASNLVFLIDVSGSMSDENKLPLLQRSMLMLVDQLTENDRVSIVTYASDAGIRLQPTSGDQKQIIRDVINSLSSGGSTHGSAGITTAYELATQNFIEGGTNRVLLATDGDLNVGVTADDELVQLIKSRAESGVFLSVLGFGTGNLKDGKLEKIADNGNGQYCYIDSIREAQKVLVSEMSGSLVTIAKDVKLQIEFNPAEVAGYRLIGYENRALKNEDFANDRIDAGDIGAGHSVTALYEIVPVQAVNLPEPAAPTGLRYQRAQAVAIEKPLAVDDESLTDEARSGELMVVALRSKLPTSSESDLLEVTVRDLNQSFNAAPADFRFAASVAAFGMKLRQSAYAGNWTWFDIENIAVATIGDDPQGQLAELVDLVRQTRKLLGR